MTVIAINTDKLKVIGAYESNEAAEKATAKQQENVHLVSTQKHLSTFKGAELVALFNSVTDADIKKFSTAAVARERVWKALSDLEVTKGKKAEAGKKTSNSRGRPVDPDLESKKIKLLPAAKDKTFHKGSMRSVCFSLLKDGMTIKTYLQKTTAKGVARPVAMACLYKLADDNQTSKTVTLS